MGWEESTFALFDDLEQQAEGVHLAGREAEVADLSAAEYAQVELASRLHASLGLEVQVRLRGGCAVSGRLARMGEDWALLVAPGAEWILRTEAVLSLVGLSPRADSVQAWPVLDRLSLRAVLRRLGAGGAPCLVRFVDGEDLEGRVGRVGRDFFELHTAAGGPQAAVVPLAAVSALQERA